MRKGVNKITYIICFQKLQLRVSAAIESILYSKFINNTAGEIGPCNVYEKLIQDSTKFNYYLFN